jgi:hypothetical protein
LRAWALDVNGVRREEVPLSFAPGHATLALAAGRRAVYYELGFE